MDILLCLFQKHSHTKWLHPPHYLVLLFQNCAPSSHHSGGLPLNNHNWKLPPNLILSFIIPTAELMVPEDLGYWNARPGSCFKVARLVLFMEDPRSHVCYQITIFSLSSAVTGALCCSYARSLMPR